MRPAKKSQIYMFAAIVFITSVFLIVSSSPSITIKDIDEYRDYLDNYLYETRIVMNNAILNNEDVSYAVKNVTGAFIEYSDEKDLDIGLASFYSKDNKIHIVNYLKDSLIVNDTLIAPENEGETDFANALEAEYQNQTYHFYFSDPNKIELKVLLVKENR